MIKVSPAKARVKYWKKILYLQRTTKTPEKVDKNGKPAKGTKWIRTRRTKTHSSEVIMKAIPIIKKGSKLYNIIIELARMPPKELIKTAKQYYSKYDIIKALLRTYKEGTEAKQRMKIRRKFVTITTGFPKHAPFIVHQIRYAIINHERGIARLDEKQIEVKSTKQKWKGVEGARGEK